MVKSTFYLTHQVPGKFVSKLLTVENDQLTPTLCNIWQFSFENFNSKVGGKKCQFCGNSKCHKCPPKALEVCNFSADLLDPSELRGLKPSFLLKIYVEDLKNVATTVGTIHRSISIQMPVYMSSLN